MGAKNIVNSSLLEYTKKSLDYPGKKYISNNNLEKAIELLEVRLSSGCCQAVNLRTNNTFLLNFLLLLKSMNSIYDRAKLLETKEYLLLQTREECC